MKEDSIPLFFGIIAFMTAIALAILQYFIRRYKDRELLKSVTELDRGTPSERKLILTLLKHGIPASTIFHDLYLEKCLGKYAQIDVVIATRVGIIVFEVKDYSGWLFGKGHQPYWTQILAYGEERYRFYNPVWQNNGHIDALKKKLRSNPDVPFYSVIVFYGNCILKNVSCIPPGTFLAYPDDVLQIIEHLLQHNPKAHYGSKTEVLRVLKEAANNGQDPKVQFQHILNVSNTTNPSL